MRTTFNAPDMKFVAGRITYMTELWASRPQIDLVRNAQMDIGNQVSNASCINTDDLEWALLRALRHPRPNRSGNPLRQRVRPGPRAFDAGLDLHGHARLARLCLAEAKSIARLSTEQRLIPTFRVGMSRTFWMVSVFESHHSPPKISLVDKIPPLSMVAFPRKLNVQIPALFFFPEKAPRQRLKL